VTYRGPFLVDLGKGLKWRWLTFTGGTARGSATLAYANSIGAAAIDLALTERVFGLETEVVKVFFR
jgi:hypothetical protein